MYEGKNPEEIAKVIRENNIDIVGVQEGATYFDEDGGKWNIVEQIAEELGDKFEFIPALDFRPDKPFIQGNGIISKYPIKEASKRELNPDDVEYDGSYETEPRIAIRTIIEAGETDLAFLSTHLQYALYFETTGIRKAQVSKLLKLVDESDKPLILAGDFNTKLDSEEIEMIENKLERIGTEKPTWTTQPFEHKGWEVNELNYRPDNIFVSDNIESRKTKLVESELSDHLMVIADIEIPDNMENEED
jgi:endonuclease/exonuclease/phosphatase family metal-dependent hydrolase